MKYLYLNILVILFTNCGHQTATVQNENISYTTVSYEDSSEIKKETDSILIINDIPLLDRFSLVNFAKNYKEFPINMVQQIQKMVLIVQDLSLILLIILISLSLEVR